MFIAMNRFQVIKGCEGDFERVWVFRDTHLEQCATRHNVLGTDGVRGGVEIHEIASPNIDGPDAEAGRAGI
jgi:hypothetical protein